MKTLRVYFVALGEEFLLGTLAEDGDDTLFEFSDEARTRKLAISPLKFPIEQLTFKPRNTRGDNPLPGFVDDSLPDGWGLLLMDKSLRQHGFVPGEIMSLDRLAILGDRAMGGLRFEPASPLETDVVRQATLAEMASDVRTILNGEPAQLLPTLLQLASPQGARPKATVWYLKGGQAMSTVPLPGMSEWLVKFPARDERPEVCAIEHVYALLAKESGIDMPETDFIPLPGAKSAAFAVKRFDRRGGQRVFVQSFAAMLDLNFRSAMLDYGHLLGLVKQVTKDHQAVVEMFRRCVFNVVFNNHDDHLKNFAFEMDKNGIWHLAPAFDITFSEGARGEHWTSVSGVGKKVKRSDLLSIAETFSIKRDVAGDIIDTVIAKTAKWRSLAAKFNVGQESIQLVEGYLKENVALCGEGQSGPKRADGESSSGLTMK